MPSWREEYLSNLQDAELRKPFNQELVQACSQMADRIAALEAEKTVLVAQIPPATQAAGTDPSSSDDVAVALLRQELAESLRSRGVAEARLRAAEEELGKLRAQTKSDAKSLRALGSEQVALTRRLKDREHEIREKRKLVEDVQDEMITLNLQLSVAEKERDRVKAENKELVDRWMARMGQEADAMNLSNEPHHSSRR